MDQSKCEDRRGLQSELLLQSNCSYNQPIILVLFPGETQVRDHTNRELPVQCVLPTVPFVWTISAVSRIASWLWHWEPMLLP